MTDFTQPRVLYIAGAGRSGSTLLDIVLGSHPELVGVGELKEFARWAWRGNGYCGCGRRVQDCPFWSDVHGRWRELAPEPDLARFGRLQERFLPLRRWRLARRALVESWPELEAYRAGAVALYRALLEVSGRRVVVDSSKVPGLAAALAGCAAVDLRVAHLVRDGRGVACSLKKPFSKDDRAGLQKEIRPRPVWRAAAHWRLANRACEELRSRLGEARARLVRYEDLVAEPEAALTVVAPLADVDLAPLGRALAAGEAVRPSCSIAGNRLRMQPEVRLLPERDGWRGRLSSAEVCLFRAVAGGTLRRYGYR